MRLQLMSFLRTCERNARQDESVGNESSLRSTRSDKLTLRLWTLTMTAVAVRIAMKVAIAVSSLLAQQEEVAVNLDLSSKSAKSLEMRQALVSKTIQITREKNKLSKTFPIY